MKQYLSRAFYLKRLIESKRAEQERMRAFAEGLARGGDGRRGSEPTDSLATGAAAASDLEADILARLAQFERVIREICDVVYGVSDERLQLILQKRYLDFERWDKIMRDLNYSKRQILRLHGEALAAATKKMAPNGT